MAETDPNIPQNYDSTVLGGLIAYLQVEGAAAASDFYQKAFGATEVFRYPPDEKGRTMHVHLHVNGTSLMLSDFYPEHGMAPVSPQGFTMQLHVEDIDGWFARAVEAGAAVTMPVQKMFWGDRYGALKDPFGVSWSMNAPDR